MIINPAAAITLVITDLTFFSRIIDWFMCKPCIHKGILCKYTHIASQLLLKEASCRLKATVKFIALQSLPMNRYYLGSCPI